MDWNTFCRYSLFHFGSVDTYWTWYRKFPKITYIAGSCNTDCHCVGTVMDRSCPRRETTRIICWIASCCRNSVVSMVVSATSCPNVERENRFTFYLTMDDRLCCNRCIHIRSLVCPSRWSLTTGGKSGEKNPEAYPRQRCRLRTHFNGCAKHSHRTLLSLRIGLTAANSTSLEMSKPSRIRTTIYSIGCICIIDTFSVPSLSRKPSHF